MYFLEKYDELSKSVSVEVFYRPEWTKGEDHMKMHFDYFQIQKWMLQIVRAEKVDE